jgi:hypothetical protein
MDDCRLRLCRRNLAADQWHGNSNLTTTKPWKPTKALIRSTAWPDPMITTLSPNEAALHRLKELSAEELPVLVMVLEKLAISLTASQKALLSLDVAAVEQGTQEQNRLARELEALCLANMALSMLDRPQVEFEEHRTPQSINRQKVLAELRAGQSRVLHLARVQAALLAKAQRFLTVLANLRNSDDATYAAPYTRSDSFSYANFHIS